MAKILLINPNKWGRGITSLWIASHSAILKENNHKVELFDSTFYSDWSENEIKFNTTNKQYEPTDYEKFVKYKSESVRESLIKKINIFKPDIIFWSALSSHIHGEGEYVNIQYGYELLKNLNLDAVLITGGIQATASPKTILDRYPKINYLISGESEFILNLIANKIKNKNEIEEIDGLSFKKGDLFVKNKPQRLINNLDDIPFYDYEIFEDQTFFRPYNGKVVRAVDYEMSRGCIYTCSYCVETVIQKHYGFDEKTPRGALREAKKYLRNKSAERVYSEFKFLKENLNIDLIRCQDTNFLTINSKMLNNLRELIKKNPLDLKLYIETRPEGINQKTVELLKDLNVDGVGMGIELAGEEFREEKLNRFADQDKILNAFKLLKEYEIKRTSYNIIGLPDQNETSIKNTIEFNRILNPDNVTVAFYSPYYGTNEQKKSMELNIFDDYEKNVDGQLRSVSKNPQIPIEKLNYYKQNFKKLVFNNL